MDHLSDTDGCLILCEVTSRSKLLPEGSYLSQSLFLGDARLSSRRAILTRYASTHLASVTTPVLLIIMSTKEDDVQNALERFEQKEFRTRHHAGKVNPRPPTSTSIPNHCSQRPSDKTTKRGLSSLYLRPTASLPTSKSSPNLSHRPATRESKRFL
jgi:hypothetical protein